ncbi:MAG: hypothetical protein LIO59_05070 [Oscillospiraceae bacterium]|nr:hypothetical protein [Oscillospiraceae bacterium]
MANAADLVVTITGDVSGLTDAVDTAKESLSSLDASAAASAGLDSIGYIYGEAFKKSYMTVADSWRSRIPSFMSERAQELFELEKVEFEHKLNSSNMPLTEQLDWWKDAAEKFAISAEAVMECEENVFSITRKIADKLNTESMTYVTDRAYFNDYDSVGDTPFDAFDRVRGRNYEDFQSGIITWQEYTDNVSSIGAAMYEERLAQSKRWLEQESKYNNLSNEDYIAGLERMMDYTAEYYDYGIITYREYCENMQSLSNAVTDKENEMNRAVYEKWLSDAENWKKLCDTYDDWEEYGDSTVQFYERCIERIGELYRDGYISWQEYSDETMNYSMDLYNAQMDEAEELLEAQYAYISRVKTELSDKESALKESWEVEDRTDDIAEVKSLMAIYKNAVTEKGKSKYADLEEQLKELEREEELYQLEKSDNEIIEKLESEYSAMESDKKKLLSSIQSAGINVQGLIDGINSDVSGIQNVMAALAAQIINAINSKSTYSDNRSFSISAADDTALKNLTKSMEETIASGRYY